MWDDPCGFVNQPMSDAAPASCWSEGRLVKVTKEFIVLCSAQYIDGEGEAKVGDYTALPLGVITDWTKL